MTPTWIKICILAGGVAVAGSIVVASVAVRQDWSQYVPDLTSGAIVGGLVAAGVGYVLWRWQTNAEFRVAQSEADQVWKVVRESVRSSLDGPWDESVLGTDEWDRDWSQVKQLFEGHLLEAVPRWSLAAPSNYELALTRNLLTHGLVVQRKASVLDFKLGIAAAEDQPDSAFKSNIVRAAWMTLRGNGEFVQDIPLVTAAAERILNNIELSEAVDDYLLAVASLRDTYFSLWTNLEPSN